MNRTIEVIEPPLTMALTTVERIMMESAIFVGADPQLVAAKILEASSDIALRCWPTLYRETVLETIYDDYDNYWVEWLNLSVWPVASITSIAVNGVEVDPAQYRLDNERRRVRWGSSPGYYGVPFGWSCNSSIAIEYTGGYLLPGQPGRDLPPSLEGACIDLVSSYWHSRGRDPTLKAETNVGVYEFQYWTGPVGESGELPPSVEAKLLPFKCKDLVW